MALILCGSFFLVFCVGASHGQSVTMEVEPKSFLPSVTPSVTLKCTVTSSSETEAFPTVLVMQLKRIPFPDSSPATAEKSKKAKKGASQPKTEDSEALVAMVTPTTPATLHVKDAENRLSVQGGISQTEAGLTLELSGPQSRDAGQYVCHVSLLDSAYLIQDRTALTNLTVIGKEGSSSLLLAKEQILETQQRHLEEEEIALEEQLKTALTDTQDLTHRVHSLELTNDNLTALVQNLSSLLSLVMAKSETADEHTSLEKEIEEHLTGTENSLIETRDKVDHLENEVVADLASKLKLLETETLVDINSRLQEIESKKAAEQSEPQQPNSSSDKDAETTKLEERISELASKVDQLEEGKVDGIFEEVNRIEHKQLPAIKDRLDQLEQDSMKSLEAEITSLQEDQNNFHGEIEKVKTKMTQVESQVTEMEEERREGRKTEGETKNGHTQLITENSTFHMEPAVEENLKVSEAAVQHQLLCVWGPPQSTPCTVDDLRAAKLQRCPADAAFCLNDIFQEENSRKIYKRCVGEEECGRMHNADRSEDCGHFSFMSQGSFQCHFCCTSSKCNLDFKPTVDLLRS